MIRLLRALTTAAAVTLAVVVAGGSSLPAGAQSAPPAQRGQRFGQMLLSLNLSAAQKTQIRSIIANARTKNASVTDPQLKRSNMRAAYAQVRTVLTPAQRAKLTAEVQQARSQSNNSYHQ